MKKVTINLLIPRNGFRSNDLPKALDGAINEAFEREGIKISKIGYTYVRSQHGEADIPKNLMAAILISEFVPSLSWKLDEWQGQYEFVFGSEDDDNETR